jgi:cytolysin (calcineurin-like family phosphatase)
MKLPGKTMKHHTFKLILLITIILMVISSCNRSNNFSFVILSDLHYDSTDVREVVIDSVIYRINSMGASRDGTETIGAESDGAETDVAETEDGGNNTNSRNKKDADNQEGKNIKFVAVLGDLTQDGREDEWLRYTRNFGLTGEADLKYPVYEIPGNHDGNIDGAVRSGIRERNLARENINRSENNLHYSWNESGVHFAALGIYPGLVWDPDCEWCHYFHESFRDPEMSLAFLEYDLKNNLQYPDQPVILFFHYGWDGFSLLWWTEAEQERFYNVIRDYNIAAVFHGHDHAIEHYQWKGIDVWSAGSPQAGERTGRFLTLDFENDSMHIYSTDIKGLELINSKIVNRRY